MSSLLSVLSQSPPQCNDWPQLQKDLKYAIDNCRYLNKYPLVIGFKAFGAVFFLASFAYIIYFTFGVGEQLRLQQIAEEDLLVSLTMLSFALAPFLGLLSVYLCMSLGATVSHWDHYFKLLKKWNADSFFQQEYNAKKKCFEGFEGMRLRVMCELKSLSNDELEQHLHNSLVQPWALAMLKDEWISRAHKV